MSSSKGCLGWNYHVWSLGSNRCSMCGRTKDSVRAEYPHEEGGGKIDEV